MSLPLLLNLSYFQHQDIVFRILKFKSSQTVPDKKDDSHSSTSESEETKEARPNTVIDNCNKFISKELRTLVTTFITKLIILPLLFLRFLFPFHT